MFTFFLCFISLWATPQKVEIWFLSPQKSVEINWPQKQSKPLQLYAQTGLSCQPFGDYCFDPQVGLYRPESALKIFEQTSTSILVEDIPQLPVPNSVERKMINCDEKYAFDIFCGTATAQDNHPKIEEPTGAVALEVWIDTSSSMKEMDPEVAGGKCKRKEWGEYLKESCKKDKRIVFKRFDTTLREDRLDSMCLNQGLNDYKRIIEWIKKSDGPHLIVLTDIYELFRDVSDFVESIGGAVRGDREPLYAKDLVSQSGDLAKLCL